MASLLRSVFAFLNRDLTGRTWERRGKHPYFGEVIYFGSKDSSKCYWEAEIGVPGIDKKIGVTMQGTTEGPRPDEEAFCRRVLSDVDALFQKCRAAFEPVFEKWAKRPLPSDWRVVFVLDGISVPSGGDDKMPWEVTYFVEPARHYFTAVFEDGAISHVQVDG